ncbi:NmrA family NAD(P)-binding protein [Cryobacterium arcticum]|uniref:NAD(P)-dependent oxidoreductase n=1 Tax=Cryobacterium arcticum TaxID=670052 RepID=A0A317ZKQ8_9MICO|nr:NmrA family NAD(P)-binding protein [Cryobacterium arcticum]PXA67101.1 NAD(P)-dependent oxidoreductase [Cryobacterium arcticum]
MSTHHAVFVTGASGTVGSSVVQYLLELGVPVVAATRSNADATRLAPGAESRHFDLAMTRMELEAALSGCDRLFLMRPPAISDVQTYLFPLIDAAQRVGIRQIVFLSLQGVQGNKRTPHHAVEQYLKRIDAPYTSLRPNFFMQNLTAMYGAEIRESSEIFVPAGRSFTAFIDARDVGRVAAAVFTSGGHLRKAYTLSGEQPLSYARIARTLSRVLQRPIHYARPSEREYLDRLRSEDRPGDYIDVQKMIYRIVRWNISAFPNRKIRQLTGRPATTFLEFAEREKAVWER